MKTILAAASLALLLVGCAAPNIDKNFDVRKADGKGVVVGSITYEGGYGAYIVHAESADGRERFRITHGSSTSINPMLAFKGEPVIPGLGKRGSLFAVELPAGDYKIRGWQISVGSFNVFSTSPVELDFKVEPQKAIYLGNFNFRVTDTFMRNPTKAVVKLSDERTRDLALLKDTYPLFADVPVGAAIADGLVIDELGGSSRGTMQMPIFVPVIR